jgi:ankyrin repeat protein
MKQNKFASIVEKYALHPEFLGIQISNPNQKGAVDDTLLHLAARTGAVDDIDVLVECGADLNAIGDLGNTPLHQAALCGQLDSAKTLVRLGAQIAIQNEFGQMACDVARLGGHLAVADFLKSRTSDTSR